MPEGDTLFRLARRMAPLAGRVITRWQARVPELATTDLTGWRISEVWPWGKNLFWRLEHAEESPQVLHTHLRMEGNWLLRPAGSGRSPDHRARLVVRVSGHRPGASEVELIGNELGFVRLWPASQYERRTKHLGPDPLAADWAIPGRWQPSGRDEAASRWQAQGEAPAAVSLLDQSILAGVGNEYRNELAFLLGINPWHPTSKVPAEQVVDLTHQVMSANLERSNRVFTGDNRLGRRHFVFLRGGEPCRNCSTTIRYGRIGGSDDITSPLAGQDRAIWWCPTCQPRI